MKLKCDEKSRKRTWNSKKNLEVRLGLLQFGSKFEIKNSTQITQSSSGFEDSTRLEFENEWFEDSNPCLNQILFKQFSSMIVMGIHRIDNVKQEIFPRACFFSVESLLLAALVWELAVCGSSAPCTFQRLFARQNLEIHQDEKTLSIVFLLLGRAAI